MGVREATAANTHTCIDKSVREVEASLFQGCAHTQTQGQCQIILAALEADNWDAIRYHAHLQDFDFLAKEYLGFGQVLLIDALYGHLPISLLQDGGQKGEEEEWEEKSQNMLQFWQKLTVNADTFQDHCNSMAFKETSRLSYRRARFLPIHPPYQRCIKLLIYNRAHCCHCQLETIRHYSRNFSIEFIFCCLHATFSFYLWQYRILVWSIKKTDNRSDVSDVERAWGDHSEFRK